MAKPLIEPVEGMATRLAAGAAHDLRNLLFVVTAHCHRLLAAAEPGHPWSEDLHAIQDAADRCTTLAGQIVAEARIFEQPSRALDVNAVVLGVEPLLTQLVGDAVALRLRLSPNAWPVSANTVQIEQVLLNLVVNARDAMPGGGTLIVSTENRAVTGAAPGQPSQFVVIAVTDTGTGIEPAVQERMFEPYFTTKAPGAGTGVGLATVRNIALIHAGHVEVSTAPGQGTTFRVVLPRAAADVSTPPARRAASDGVSPSLRILLVAQEPAACEFLRNSLEHDGHQVAVVANGAEAIGWSGTTDRPADVIVASLFLSDLNGLDVAGRLREIWPGAGVVFLSDGFDPIGDLPEGAPVLVKPFTAAAVTTAIRRATGQGRAA